ncbi:MAG: M48 family metallopeptidase [Planctomycetota bacterium]
MNFYEHQDRARRNTGKLIALFFAAILGITLMVWGLAVAILFIAGNSDEARFVSGEGGLGAADFPWLESFAGTFLGVGVLIGGASLTKIAQLRGGGGMMVAESLGGTPISPDTTDPDERKVLNVVEEMAIASGLPVPPVYLMDRETGINAFAAGYRPENAVIGVTRGCVESLTRDELQGVMAHEFAHILNGDMRINIKLMGTIFGILILTVIGRLILNSIFYSGAVRSRSRDGEGGAKLAMLAIGIGLLVIGFVGVFFGRLIHAAVSRQREFLADASAVQFTRNPDGIGDALRRIGGAVHGMDGGRVRGPRGSEMKSAHAEEAAHIFFGNAVKNLRGAFATHPPLEQRIARVLPDWDGKFLPPLGGNELPQTPAIARAAAQPQGSGGSRKQGLEDIPVLGRIPEAVGQGGALGFAGGGAAASGFEQSVGTLDEAHVAAAREMIAALPDPIRQAARDPVGGRALVFALLLDRDPAVRAEQLSAIERRATGAEAKRAEQLADAALALPRALRLPAVDLAVPTLSSMTNPEYRKFVAVVEALIGADDRVDLFEWALREVVRRHVGVRFDVQARDRVTARRLGEVRVPLQAVLSALAAVGANDMPPAEGFANGAAVLKQADPGMASMAYVDPRKAGGMQTLTAAVDALEGLAPRLKEPVVRACVAVVSADGMVTGGEAELLRVVVESMGVPVPPVLPGAVGSVEVAR